MHLVLYEWIACDMTLNDTRWHLQQSQKYLMTITITLSSNKSYRIGNSYHNKIGTFKLMGAKPAKERPGVGVLLSEKDLTEADEDYDDEMIVTPPGKINFASCV